MLGSIISIPLIFLALALPSTATTEHNSVSDIAPIDTQLQQQSSFELPLVKPAPAPTISAAANPTPTTIDMGKWHTVKVRQGDNLSTLFARIGLPPGQLYNAMAVGKDADTLKRLLPNKEIKIYTSKDTRQLRGLVYQISETRRLEIVELGNGLESRIIETPLETRIAHATGTISSSLFIAAQQAGLSDNLTMELANLFGWDVDFALDIREGDQFSLIYEERYLHGEKLRDGNILAAEFINQGHSYRAIRFTGKDHHDGYFTPDGKSVRKAFLRTPVEFSRISSRFSLHRKHPKLNTIRAHKGVDYAAKTGTPVRATGDGKIIHRATKGGYGRTIIVQHGTKYSTLYAHLNSYAKKLRTGSQVRQGQIIGFVGKTGLATGPHLHYEFRVNDTHRNPLTVKLPDAAPLAQESRDDFNRIATPLIAQLDTLKRTTLALNH
jgi:murein DD-endopeptidase MepM/ murein hydrolase activator NlpD